MNFQFKKGALHQPHKYLAKTAVLSYLLVCLGNALSYRV